MFVILQFAFYLNILLLRFIFIDIFLWYSI